MLADSLSLSLSLRLSSVSFFIIYYGDGAQGQFSQGKGLPGINSLRSPSPSSSSPSPPPPSAE